MNVTCLFMNVTFLLFVMNASSETSLLPTMYKIIVIDMHYF